MTPREAIKRLREAKVPEQIIEPLEALLVTEMPIPRTVGQALASAWSAWAERERRLGREPGELPLIQPGLDAD